MGDTFFFVVAEVAVTVVAGFAQLVLVEFGELVEVFEKRLLERFGRGGVYLTSIGDATLVIELRDSESGEILARAADRRAAESPFAFEVNNVTAWSEVRRLASYWASLLRRRLEEIEGV